MSEYKKCCDQREAAFRYSRKIIKAIENINYRGNCILGNKLYKIYKISTDKIISSKDKNQFNLGKHSYEDAVMNGEVVSIMDNQVLHKIRDCYKDNNVSEKDIKNIANDLVNIIVPMDTEKRR